LRGVGVSMAAIILLLSDNRNSWVFSSVSRSF
jgi:hypothetical protein